MDQDYAGCDGIMALIVEKASTFRDGGDATETPTVFEKIRMGVILHARAAPGDCVPPTLVSSAYSR